MVTGTGGGDSMGGYGKGQPYEDMGVGANVIGEHVFANGTQGWTEPWPRPVETKNCEWKWIVDGTTGNKELMCIRLIPYSKWEWDKNVYKWTGKNRRRSTWQWLEGPVFAANDVNDLLPAGDPSTEAANAGTATNSEGKYEDMKTEADNELESILTTASTRAKRQSDPDEQWENFHASIYSQ